MEEEQKNILPALKSKAEFNAFVRKERERIIDREAYVQVNLKYCDSCCISYIEYKYFKPVIKGSSAINWIEDEDR